MDRNGLVRVLTLSSLNYARFFFGLWTFRKTLNLKDRELMSTGEAEKMKKCKKNWFLWVFPNIMVPPQIIHFNRVFHYKPSILGYPYFWKHPSRSGWWFQICFIFTPNLGEMIHFDLRIFFKKRVETKWVGSTTN